MNKVVITGIGILSSIGNNKKEVLNSLFKNISGITYSKEMRLYGMYSNVWGNIKININDFINNRLSRFMNDGTIYSYLAMKEAIKDSFLLDKQYQFNPYVGIIVGSSGGSPKSKNLSINSMYSNKGIKILSPYIAIKSMTSNISACLGTLFKLNGVNYSISSACSSSSHCIGNAFELIQMGKQKIIFAGGGEELNAELACEFDSMKALSRNYNFNPEKSSRVYDKNRDGFVISGGAGIIVLEELHHALSRKAKIYAEIVGYSSNSDGYNFFLPSGEGAVRCMKNALKFIKSPVEYINVHGTSTKLGDIIELNAIKKVFKNDIPKISSTKSLTGHSLGVSGVHEIIYTLLMLENNFIAPSVNIENIDNNAKNMNIVRNILCKNFNIAMSNSFGFGGVNSTIIIKKYN
ncbi:beta-ketoacyl synthase N-terminal-like domain-containing protein [Buchnera aphidicola]|uniref:beta-ketoacyl synthase N-terminal-like domain-containing protein n=1 Tax=Buchnera aphidicola TaxID=9 RepID=UPI0031B83551